MGLNDWEIVEKNLRKKIQDTAMLVAFDYEGNILGGVTRVGDDLHRLKQCDRGLTEVPKEIIDVTGVSVLKVCSSPPHLIPCPNRKPGCWVPVK